MSRQYVVFRTWSWLINSTIRNFILLLSLRIRWVTVQHLWIKICYAAREFSLLVLQRTRFPVIEGHYTWTQKLTRTKQAICKSFNLALCVASRCRLYTGVGITVDGWDWTICRCAATAVVCAHEAEFVPKRRDVLWAVSRREQCAIFLYCKWLCTEWPLVAWYVFCISPLFLCKH